MLTALDGAAATEIPIISQVAGVVNIGLGGAQGDWTSVTLGAAGLIPFGGNVADAAKIAKRLNKLEHTVEATRTVYQGFE